MRARAIALLSAAAVVTTAAAPQGAAAAASVSPERALAAVKRANSLEAPLVKGWTGFPAEFPLAKAKFSMMVGVPTADGGCDFDPKWLTLPKGQEAIHQRSRAVAMEGCVEILETGVPPADIVAQWRAEDRAAASADAAGPDEATALATEEAPDSWTVQDEFTPDVGVGDPPTPGYDDSAGVASISPGARSTADYVNQAIVYKVRHEDPIYIDVTELRQQLNWTHEGPTGCVRAVSSAMDTDWFEQSGWVRNDANKRLGYTCSRGFSSGYAKYTNHVFCKALDHYLPGGLPGPLVGLIPATKVYYNRSIARGFNTGARRGNTRHSKKGGCASLLGFQRELYEIT